MSPSARSGDPAGQGPGSLAGVRGDLRVLAAAVESVSDPGAVLDEAGLVRFANGALARFARSDPGALAGVPIWKVPGLPLDSAALETLRGAVENRRSHRVEVSLPDDRDPLELRLLPAGGSGDATGYLFWIRGGSSRVARVEAELQRQADRARELAALLESYLLLEDFDAFLQRALEGAARVVGADFAEIIWPGARDEQLTIRAFVGWDPESVARVIVRPHQGTPTAQALATGQPVAVSGLGDQDRYHQPELHERHGVKAGVTVPLVAEGRSVGALGVHLRRPRAVDDGEVQFLVSIARIVMAAWQRSLATESLEKSRTQLDAIFRASADGLYLLRVSPDGRHVFELSNPALETITGLDLSGRQLEDLLGAEPAGESRERVDLIVRTGETLRTEKEYSLPVGRRRLAISRSPIVGADGSVERVVGVVRDVTVEHELQERLEGAERMEALSRLAGGMAHELNNVLTGILGNVALLQERLGSQGSGQDELASIRRDARRAADLVGHIVQFSGHESPELSPFDLGSELTGLVDVLRAELGEGVEVRVEEPVSPLSVVGDSAALAELLVNLARNARDAMPEGGTFLLRARGEDVLDPERAAVLGLETGPYAVLTVVDSGRGMDEETRRRVFEPFFTTKEPGQATGVGLAASYSTMRRGGGSVRVESAPGEGTTFEVYLPRASAAAARPSAVERGQETILLVEDEETVRRVTSRLLKKLGYTVFAASDAGEAMEVFEKRGPEVDLVLTDVVMPGLTGIEMAEALRREHPELRVLFTSGYTSKELGRSPGAPPEPFLPKPFSLEELSGRVREVLDAPPPPGNDSPAVA